MPRWPFTELTKLDRLGPKISRGHQTLLVAPAFTFGVIVPIDVVHKHSNAIHKPLAKRVAVCQSDERSECT
jgi:hypothetical protein